MFVANREPGTQQREWGRDARDEMEGEIDPCPARERRRWLGHGPAPHPSRRQDISSAQGITPTITNSGATKHEPHLPNQSIPR